MAEHRNTQIDFVLVSWDLEADARAHHELCASSDHVPLMATVYAGSVDCPKALQTTRRLPCGWCPKDAEAAQAYQKQVSSLLGFKQLPVNKLVRLVKFPALALCPSRCVQWKVPQTCIASARAQADFVHGFAHGCCVDGEMGWGSMAFCVSRWNSRVFRGRPFWVAAGRGECDVLSPDYLGAECRSPIAASLIAMAETLITVRDCLKSDPAIQVIAYSSYREILQLCWGDVPDPPHVQLVRILQELFLQTSIAHRLLLVHCRLREGAYSIEMVNNSAALAARGSFAYRPCEVGSWMGPDGLQAQVLQVSDLLPWGDLERDCSAIGRWWSAHDYRKVVGPRSPPERQSDSGDVLSIEHVCAGLHDAARSVQSKPRGGYRDPPEVLALIQRRRVAEPQDVPAIAKQVFHARRHAWRAHSEFVRDQVSAGALPPKAWLRLRKSPHPSFRGKSGEIVHEAQVISKEVGEFYAELFKMERWMGSILCLLMCWVIVLGDRIEAGARSEDNARRLDGLPSLQQVSMEEVPSQLSFLSPGKAAGPDWLVAEAIVHGGPALAQWIAKVLSKRTRGKVCSQSWQTVATTLIPKFKGACKVDEFRPISVANVLQRLLGRVLLSRLHPYLQSFEMLQFGGRQGMNPSDAQHALHMLSKSFEWKTPLHVVSLDIRKAYDRLKKVACL